MISYTYISNQLKHHSCNDAFFIYYCPINMLFSSVCAIILTAKDIVGNLVRAMVMFSFLPTMTPLILH